MVWFSIYQYYFFYIENAQVTAAERYIIDQIQHKDLRNYLTIRQNGAARNSKFTYTAYVQLNLY